MLKRTGLFSIALALAVILSSSGLRTASAKDTANDERERAVKAADVLSEVMQISENGIPNELRERAEAVAVIPNMIKGAFGLGGEYGKGLISERLSNGKWSAPSYMKIGGGNFGLQLGVQSTDLVLVFTNREGVKGLINGKLKLGADAAVAAGPVGRNAQVATDVLLKSPIFAYSRSKGLFAGIALDGSVVTIDESANRRVYGKDIPSEDILSGKVRVNNVAAPFVQALEKYSPPRKRVTD
jgi:lipid-binding SYLF domain-containing protein